MESNGKSVNRFGEPVNYATGPVIFGEPYFISKIHLKILVIKHL